MNTHARHRLQGSFLALLLVLPAAAANAQEVAGATEVPLRIAAGPASGSMFSIAGIVANVISNPPGGRPCPASQICGYPGLVGEARSTASGSANLDAMATGHAETAFVAGDLLWQAYNGFGRFAGRPLGDLRSLAVLYTESVLMIVPARSPVQTIADLRGKSLAVGVPEDPHQRTIGQILLAHGVRMRDLTLIHLSTEAAAAAVAHNEVDAAVLVAPSLPEAFRRLAERTPLRLLPVEPETGRDLAQRHPYLMMVEIGDLEQDRVRTPGVAIPVLWVATQRLSAVVAHALLRSLHAPANEQILTQSMPSSSAVAPESELTRSPIPLHLGAARWYEEASGVVR